MGSLEVGVVVCCVEREPCQVPIIIVYPARLPRPIDGLSQNIETKLE